MTPRWSFLLFTALCAVPIVAGIWYAPLLLVGKLAVIVLVVVALLDLVVSPSLAQLEIERTSSDVMSVGAKNPVRIWLRNPTNAEMQVEVHDEPPEPFEQIGLPHMMQVPAKRRRYFVYHVIPKRRGKNQFGQVFLRQKSKWGLWVLRLDVSLPQPVRIYPDIKAVHGVELLARRNRLAEAGVRMSRLRGRGNEFDRLREYRREDEYRSIDWKATARSQSLISREYVVEKNQNILFVLDCGRSMCNAVDGIVHFDRALNAAIMLSYIALRQGDSVGMMAVSNKVRRWIPPVRGTSGVQTLIRHSYDLEPDYEATDYQLMMTQLQNRYRKRSLIVLLTHTVDDVHLEYAAQSLRQAGKQHLYLSAFLKDVALIERATEVPANRVESFQIAAASEIADAQRGQLAQLEQNGMLVIHALPDQLSAQLISGYLDIKARHLL